MSNLNLRLTHKANDAFRELLGPVVSSTLEPFCATRKVEVVYSFSPGDVPLASIGASLLNHTVAGRTGKSLDRLLEKIKTYLTENGIKTETYFGAVAEPDVASDVATALAPLTKIVAEPPADMTDVLEALDKIPPPADATEEADEDAAMSAPDVQKILNDEFCKDIDKLDAKEATKTVQEKVASMSLVPKIRAADRLANLYKDMKKGKKK